MRMLKIGLSLITFAAMIVVCVIQFYYAGMGGLAGGALGAVLGMIWPGQHDARERMGNAYIAALTGMCVLFAVFGLGFYVYEHFADWVTFIADLAS